MSVARSKAEYSGVHSRDRHAAVRQVLRRGEVPRRASAQGAGAGSTRAVEPRSSRERAHSLRRLLATARSLNR